MRRASERRGREPCRWCSRTRNRRSIRAAASPASSPRRWKPAAGMRPGTSGSTRAEELLARSRAAVRVRGAPARPTLRRPASARQHRARAVQLPKVLIADEIVSGPRCLDPGAAPQSAGAAARRTRLRHAVHFARSLGRAAPVQPRAGDVSRRDRRTRADRRSLRQSAASAYASIVVFGPAGRACRNVAVATGKREFVSRSRYRSAMIQKFLTRLGRR